MLKINFKRNKVKICPGQASIFSLAVGNGHGPTGTATLYPVRRSINWLRKKKENTENCMVLFKMCPFNVLCSLRIVLQPRPISRPVFESLGIDRIFTWSCLGFWTRRTHQDHIARHPDATELPLHCLDLLVRILAVIRCKASYFKCHQ